MSHIRPVSLWDTTGVDWRWAGWTYIKNSLLHSKRDSSPKNVNNVIILHPYQYNQALLVTFMSSVVRIMIKSWVRLSLNVSFNRFIQFSKVIFHSLGPVLEFSLLPQWFSPTDSSLAQLNYLVYLSLILIQLTDSVSDYWLNDWVQLIWT